ncbi:MAG: hypothetical protein JWR51_4640 [Devosia sp.]|uniref:hypothetical protein n=1 Tax=Devosia sp. TaxID=1871048 RepID=UPI00260C983E|nr:hypothetical protein [Devosia sp.]MDB5531537.1 hypothetical protein [Devosia sp.]
MSQTDFAFAAVLVVGFASLCALWYSQRALKQATSMLETAGEYWRRSSEVWDAIDATPGEYITEEAARKMEAFLAEETDQLGLTPSDYFQAKDKP